MEGEVFRIQVEDENEDSIADLQFQIPQISVMPPGDVGGPMTLQTSGSDTPNSRSAHSSPRVTPLQSPINKRGERLLPHMLVNQQSPPSGDLLKPGGLSGEHGLSMNSRRMVEKRRTSTSKAASTNSNKHLDDSPFLHTSPDRPLSSAIRQSSPAGSPMEQDLMPADHRDSWEFDEPEAEEAHDDHMEVMEIPDRVSLKTFVRLLALVSVLFYLTIACVTMAVINTEVQTAADDAATLHAQCLNGASARNGEPLSPSELTAAAASVDASLTTVSKVLTSFLLDRHLISASDQILKNVLQFGTSNASVAFEDALTNGLTGQLNNWGPVFVALSTRSAACPSVGMRIRDGVRTRLVQFQLSTQCSKTSAAIRDPSCLMVKTSFSGGGDSGWLQVSSGYLSTTTAESGSVNATLADTVTDLLNRGEGLGNAVSFDRFGANSTMSFVDGSRVFTFVSHAPHVALADALYGSSFIAKTLATILNGYGGYQLAIASLSGQSTDLGLGGSGVTLGLAARSPNNNSSPVNTTATLVSLPDLFGAGVAAIMVPTFQGTSSVRGTVALTGDPVSIFYGVSASSVAALRDAATASTQDTADNAKASVLIASICVGVVLLPCLIVAAVLLLNAGDEMADGVRLLNENLKAVFSMQLEDATRFGPPPLDEDKPEMSISSRPHSASIRRPRTEAKTDWVPFSNLTELREAQVACNEMVESLKNYRKYLPDTLFPFHNARDVEDLAPELMQAIEAIKIEASPTSNDLNPVSSPAPLNLRSDSPFGSSANKDSSAMIAIAGSPRNRNRPGSAFGTGPDGAGSSQHLSVQAGPSSANASKNGSFLLLPRRTSGGMIGAPDAPVSERALTGFGLKKHRSTILSITFAGFLRMSQESIPEAHLISQTFLQIVLAVVDRNDGVVLSMTADRVVATWNAFKSEPNHEARGAVCAHELSRTLQAADEEFLLPDLQSAIAVTSGVVASGHSGTFTERSSVVHGQCVKLADELLSLFVGINVRCGITKLVAGALPNPLWALPIDIITESDSSVVDVFELRSGDRPPFVAPYIDGFERFAEGDYAIARELFAEAVRKSMPNVDPHAVRLLKLCLLFSTLPVPYIRTLPAWQRFESDDNGGMEVMAPKRKYKSEKRKSAMADDALRIELMNLRSPLQKGNESVAGRNGLLDVTPSMEFNSLASSMNSDGGTPRSARSPSNRSLLSMSNSMSQRPSNASSASGLLSADSPKATSPKNGTPTKGTPFGSPRGSPKGSPKGSPGAGNTAFTTMESNPSTGSSKSSPNTTTTLSIPDMNSRASSNLTRKTSGFIKNQLGSNPNLTGSTNSGSNGPTSRLGVSGESIGSRAETDQFVQSPSLSATKEGAPGSPTKSPIVPVAVAPLVKTNVVEFKDRKDMVFRMSDNVLGRGAVGEVLMGMTEAGGLVAIKSVPLPAPVQNADQKAMNPIQLRRLRRKGVNVSENQEQDVEALLNEVAVLSRLRHENIVGYLSSSIVNGKLLVVMEFISGGSLFSMLKEFKAVPVGTARRYLRDTLRGLQFLHSEGIVHRDIKPHNVLLLIDGSCKLTDFGTSANLNKLAGNSNAEGTPQYMAPEACKNNAVIASDIWSFGVMMAQLLTGELPWQMDDFVPIRFMYSLANDESMVPTIPNSIPDEAQRVLEKCFKRDATERCTAEQLLEMPFFSASSGTPLRRRKRQNGSGSGSPNLETSFSTRSPGAIRSPNTRTPTAPQVQPPATKRNGRLSVRSTFEGFSAFGDDSENENSPGVDLGGHIDEDGTSDDASRRLSADSSRPDTLNNTAAGTE